MPCTKIAQQLGTTGLSIWPNFLPPDELLAVQADFGHIQTVQGFHRGGTGQGKGLEVRDRVRRDEIHWLDRTTASPAQLVLWGKLDLLKQAFNRTLYLGLSKFEGHYAAFPNGGFYKRHLDCFREDRTRIVSLVLYLNTAWTTLDGGQLRVYDGKSYTDVDPVGGTLVCFMSGESEHEVLQSHAARSSFTGWFKQYKLADQAGGNLREAGKSLMKARGLLYT